MRSARSRHLRSACTEPVNQKAPLCHIERGAIDEHVWFKASPATPLLCFVSVWLFFTFFCPQNPKFVPIRWGFKRAVSPGGSCQIGQRWPLRENRPPGSRCHLSELLLNLRFYTCSPNSKKNTLEVTSIESDTYFCSLIPISPHLTAPGAQMQRDKPGGHSGSCWLPAEVSAGSHKGLLITVVFHLFFFFFLLVWALSLQPGKKTSELQLEQTPKAGLFNPWTAH